MIQERSGRRLEGVVVGVLFALSGVLGGCGGTHFRGVVVTMPGRTESGAYVAPEPISRARVVLWCGPGRRVVGSYTTDELGRLDADLEGMVANGCWIEAARAGFVTRRVRVVEACAIGDRNRCDGIGFLVRLVREEPRR